MTASITHPSMLSDRPFDGYYLVALDRDGNALYGWRNWRVGGKKFALRRQDGSVCDWTDNPPYPGKTRPKKAPTGRWKWDQDMKEGFA